MRSEHMVSARRRRLDRLSEHTVGPAQIGQSLHHAHVGHELDPERVIGRKESHAPRDEVHTCRSVTAQKGASPGSTQSLGRATPYRTRHRVDGAQLRSIQKRLLQVVAEDLLELERALAGHLLEPTCEALVQPRTYLLRHRLIRSVPDQEMAKPIRGLARKERSVRADQFLT